MSFAKYLTEEDEDQTAKVHDEEDERRTQKTWYYYWTSEDVCDLKPGSPWPSGRGAWIARGDARQRDGRGSMAEHDRDDVRKDHCCV